MAAPPPLPQQTVTMDAPVLTSYSISCRYLMLLSPVLTSCSYLLSLPHALISYFTHALISYSTSCSYLILLPTAPTSCSHLPTPYLLLFVLPLFELPVEDEAVGGYNSDEYSDDDDPGYRIVLVEDVGELYPDISYRLRRRGGSQSHQTIQNHLETPEKTKPSKLSTGPRIDTKATNDAVGSKAAEKRVEDQADTTTEYDLAVSSSGKPQGYKEVDPTRNDVAKNPANVEITQPDASNQVSTAAEDEDNEEEVADEGVQEDMLAAHHMPDLIEGAQPMFVSEHSQDNLTPPNAAMKPQLSFPSDTEKAEDVPVVSKGTGKGNLGSAARSQTDVKTSTNSALPPPVLSASRPNGTGRSEENALDGGDDTVYYDCFDLKIVYERNRTGFEESKDYPIEINGVIAGRYQILEFLGAAAFSKAVQCVDLTDGSYVCIKIIKNNKDFFDQSLDEIKILKYINAHDSRDEHHLLQLFDYFYFKEHLFIVTELLRDNLYEFSKFNRESGAESYFTMPRLQKITKVNLRSYVQSRSYRAPEVILGLPYDQQIDMWSLGCILAELWTGRVCWIAVLHFEADVMLQGRYTHRFFTKTKIIYDRLSDDNGSLVYIFPKKTTLRHRLGTDDALFIDFIVTMLPGFTAEQALHHPWLSYQYS
eukprot:759328-Hanusia_phi.AAC.2